MFKGVSNSAEKIVSVFEPQTKILRRGKAATEVGQILKVQEAGVEWSRTSRLSKSPTTRRWVPSVEHKEVFGRSPHVVATDRGFFSIDNMKKGARSDGRSAALPDAAAVPPVVERVHVHRGKWGRPDRHFVELTLEQGLRGRPANQIRADRDLGKRIRVVLAT